MEEGFARYTVQRLVNAGDQVGFLEVAGGDTHQVELVAVEDFDYALADGETWLLQLSGPGFVYAPAVEGAEAGFIHVMVEGKAVGKVPIVYGSTIEQVKDDKIPWYKRLS